MNETPTEILTTLRHAVHDAVQAADNQLKRHEITVTGLSVARIDVTTCGDAAAGLKSFVTGSIAVHVAISGGSG